jgi:hypothetical protein
MYRPAWFEKAAEGRSVLAIALDVHMTSVGSCERPAADQKRDLKLLRHVAESWKANTTGVGRDFDLQVLKLVLAAMHESNPVIAEAAKREYQEGIVP